MDGLWKSCEGLAAAEGELQLPSEPRNPIAPNAQCHRTGTDIPIHRHSDKDESFAILRGKVRSTTYNNDGSVIESVVLCQEEVVYGVDIPKGVWHKLESLESGGVEFECKEGPFVSALMILLLKPPLLLVVGLGL